MNLYFRFSNFGMVLEPSQAHHKKYILLTHPSFQHTSYPQNQATVSKCSWYSCRQTHNNVIVLFYTRPAWNLAYLAHVYQSTVEKNNNVQRVHLFCWIIKHSDFMSALILRIIKYLFYVQLFHISSEFYDSKWSCTQTRSTSHQKYVLANQIVGLLTVSQSQNRKGKSRYFTFWDQLSELFREACRASS